MNRTRRALERTRAQLAALRAKFKKHRQQAAEDRAALRQLQRTFARAVRAGLKTGNE